MGTSVIRGLTGPLQDTYRRRALSGTFRIFICLVVLTTATAHGRIREKDATQYGAGIMVNLPFTEAEVAQVVQDVVQDGIIRGSKEYNKDEYVSGATAAVSTRIFPEWTEGGKVFYKVRFKAIDPRNFKNGSDVGTLAVRYIIQPQGEKNTVLKIDALFVEDFRHIVHQSNGSVEGAEYKDIHDRLDSIAVMKAETSEATKARQGTPQPSAQPAANTLQPVPAPIPTTVAEETTRAAAEAATVPMTTVPMTLEQRVDALRRQVERTVKAPGAPLKSAPFHTASTLQSLPTGAEVLIVIETPYWYGVETHEGQHGWMLRDELEQKP